MNHETMKTLIVERLADISPKFRRGVAVIQSLDETLKDGEQFQLAPHWAEKYLQARRVLQDLQHLFSTWDVIENPRDPDRCDLIQSADPVPNCPPPPMGYSMQDFLPQFPGN
jgi:hypothetical protein